MAARQAGPPQDCTRPEGEGYPKATVADPAAAVVAAVEVAAHAAAAAAEAGAVAVVVAVVAAGAVVLAAEVAAAGDAAGAGDKRMHNNLGTIFRITNFDCAYIKYSIVSVLSGTF